MLNGKCKYRFLLSLALFAYLGQMMLVLLMPCCNGLESSAVDMQMQVSHQQHHESHENSMKEMTMSDSHSQHAIHEGNLSGSDQSQSCSFDCDFCGVVALATLSSKNSHQVDDYGINALPFDFALLKISLDTPYKPPISA
jgi:hypothetical protein